MIALHTNMIDTSLFIIIYWCRCKASAFQNDSWCKLYTNYWCYPQDCFSHWKFCKILQSFQTCCAVDAIRKPNRKHIRFVLWYFKSCNGVTSISDRTNIKTGLSAAIFCSHWVSWGGYPFLRSLKCNMEIHFLFCLKSITFMQCFSPPQKAQLKVWNLWAQVANDFFTDDTFVVGKKCNLSCKSFIILLF